MTRALTDSEWLYITRANKRELGAFHKGAILTVATGLPAPSLVCQAVAHRITLASNLLHESAFAMQSTPPLFRLAINRAYYSLYHAFRATMFFYAKGDDHQDHSELPARLPQDFPNRDVWMNALKNARMERNRADYEPYPIQSQHWSVPAATVLEDATKALPAIVTYLQTKGCQYV